MGWTNVGVGITLGTLVGVVALSGCSRYMNQSKAAEARNSLGQIGRLAASAYERERMQTGLLTQGGSMTATRSLCGSAANTVPSSAEAIRGKKYMSAPSDWQAGSENDGWPCLKFDMSTPQYFMYGYRRTGEGSKPGDSFTATANGDLDGNGTLSKYELTGKVGASGVTVAPAIAETDPFE